MELIQNQWQSGEYASSSRIQWSDERYRVGVQKWRQGGKASGV